MTNQQNKPIEPVQAAHDGDCSYYSSLVNEQPEDGICTCGHALKLIREGDWTQLYSEERKLQSEKPVQAVEGKGFEEWWKVNRGSAIYVHATARWAWHARDAEVLALKEGLRKAKEALGHASITIFNDRSIKDAAYVDCQEALTRIAEVLKEEQV